MCISPHSICLLIISAKTDFLSTEKEMSSCSWWSITFKKEMQSTGSGILSYNKHEKQPLNGSMYMTIHIVQY
jgi:hypothetical protein